MKIGKLEFESDLVLAPMSGVTNTAFRKLLRKENGSSLGLVVTEFISIEGLTREIPQTLRMMNFDEIERPISIQIFGYDINKMCDAAMMVQDTGADIIDINCGCPAPKVVKRGGGCQLMREPEHLAKMLSSVRSKVSIPFTLKIRSGWDADSVNAMQIAKMAEDCGVDMLAIHGRTRSELYRGKADWQLVAEVANELSIPVIGSGDVVDKESADLARNLGIAGIMIGRGAMHNPWVFREINSGAIRALDYETPRVLLDYMQLLLEIMSEKGAIGKMKQLGSQATRRVTGSGKLRKALCRSKTLDEMTELLVNWQEELKANPVSLESINSESESSSLKSSSVL